MPLQSHHNITFLQLLEGKVIVLKIAILVYKLLSIPITEAVHFFLFIHLIKTYFQRCLL